MSQLTAVQIKEVKNLKCLKRDNSGKITIPISFIRKLGYEYQQELFIILFKDKLMVLDDKNYLKLNMKYEGIQIRKTKLTGFQSKNTFHYIIYINKQYMKDLGIDKDIPIEIYLKDYGLILSKYVI
jgi:hypothetical protein